MTRPAVSATSLGATDRKLLAAMADVLIPEGDGMPSASAAGVAANWLDEVLRVRPDFGPPLLAALDQARGGDPAEAVSRLRDADPTIFAVLADVVAGAYFLNPDVRNAIRYRGQQAVPIVVESPPDYEQDGLLTSVRSRGSIYRPTPPRIRT